MKYNKSEMPTPLGPIETWNYRLIKEDAVILVAEVHYHQDGVPYGYSDATVLGDTLEEAQEVYKMMQPAFDNPVLNAKTDFVEGSKRMKKELQELYPEHNYDDWDDDPRNCPMCGHSQHELIDEIRHGAGI